VCGPDSNARGSIKYLELEVDLPDDAGGGKPTGFLLRQKHTKLQRYRDKAFPDSVKVLRA